MFPKFRAFEKETGKMLEVIEIDFQNQEVTVIDQETSKTKRLKKDEYETMQSTEQYDKKGNEIFEGDIVERENGLIVTGRDLGFSEEHISRVMEGKPKNKSYIITNLGYAFFLGNLENPKYSGVLNHKLTTKDKDLEVIGNIYQNKELLEQLDK